MISHYLSVTSSLPKEKVQGPRDTRRGFLGRDVKEVVIREYRTEEVMVRERH